MLWECKWTAHAEDPKLVPWPPRKREAREARVQHTAPASGLSAQEQGQWDGDLLGRLNGPWATESLQEVVCPLHAGLRLTRLSALASGSGLLLGPGVRGFMTRSCIWRHPSLCLTGLPLHCSWPCFLPQLRGDEMATGGLSNTSAERLLWSSLLTVYADGDCHWKREAEARQGPGPWAQKPKSWPVRDAPPKRFSEI